MGWNHQLEYTLPETNIAPENGWLEDEFPFREGLFSGAMLVSGSVYYILSFLVKLSPCSDHVNNTLGVSLNFMGEISG